MNINETLIYLGTIGTKFLKLLLFLIDNKKLWLLLGPCFCIITTLLLNKYGMALKPAMTAGVSVWMITWWLVGPIRMGITGLLPIAIFPVLGVVSGDDVSRPYFGDSIMVFLGSVIIAMAIEDYGLHKRFAAIILHFTESGGDRGILFGFIFTAGILSMWLSNSATAALMVPLAKSVFKDESDTQAARSKLEKTNLQIAIDLGIAYGASLGGMATLTGTGSNIVLKGVMASMFPPKDNISYIRWFIMAAPLSLLNLLILWALLTYLFLRKVQVEDPAVTEADGDGAITTPAGENPMHEYHHVGVGHSREDNALSPADHSLRAERVDGLVPNRLRLPLDDTENQKTDMPEDASTCVDCKSDVRSVCDGDIIDQVVHLDSCTDLNGPWNSMGFAEYSVLIAFVLMAALWLTRDPPGGWGWALLFPEPEFITDGTVAIACSLILFFLPLPPGQLALGPRQRHNEGVVTVLRWTIIQSIKWDVVFLLGGGFALSLAFQESGLSLVLGSYLESHAPAELWLLIALSCGIATTATNIMSNVATSNILLPTLACMGPARNVPPLQLLVPVTMCTSLAMLFPIGTPPNAFIMTNGNVSLTTMAKVGSIATLLFLFTTLVFSTFLLPYVIGFKASDTSKEACML